MRLGAEDLKSSRRGVSCLKVAWEELPMGYKGVPAGVGLQDKETSQQRKEGEEGKICEIHSEGCYGGSPAELICR